MRLATGPMTRVEFDEALELARDGLLVTDHGANDEIDAALLAVALDAPNPRPDLVRAAQDAFTRRT